MTFRAAIIQLIGLLLLAVLIICAIPLLTPLVSQYMQNHTQQVFNDNGFNWVNIAYHERDISLSGLTLDQQTHKDVINLTKSLWYVRNIHDNITPKTVKPYTLHLYADREKLKIETYVENTAHKTELQEHIEQIKQDRNVIKDIKMAFGKPEKWTELQTLLLKHLNQLELLSVSVVEHDLTISAAAKRQKTIDNLKAEFKNIKDMGFNITQHDLFAYDHAISTCQKNFQALLNKGNIKFESNQSIIQESSFSLLEDIKNNALLCINAKIKIVGHTDNIGNDNNNQVLSYNRAFAVKSWLFNHGGIPVERLEAIGQGASQPIASNKTKTGRAQNRRIEFIVEGIE